MSTKISFYASLFEKGLLGGAAYLDGEGFRFVCQKATADRELREVRIPYCDIKSVCAVRENLLPLTIIETCCEKSYKFLIFNRKRFIGCISKIIERASEHKDANNF